MQPATVQVWGNLSHNLGIVFPYGKPIKGMIYGFSGDSIQFVPEGLSLLYTIPTKHDWVHVELHKTEQL